jgi:hypothetical protein
VDERLDDRPEIPSTESPEASTTQCHDIHASDSDLHTVPPLSTDTHAEDIQAPATMGAHDSEEGPIAPAPATTGAHDSEEGPIAPATVTTGAHDSEKGPIAPATVETALAPATAEGAPASATAEGTLPLSLAPPTDVSRTEDPPPPKKRKISARAIVSDCISDKCGTFLIVFDSFLIPLIGIYVDKIGSRITKAAQRTNIKDIGSPYPKRNER